MAWLNCLPTFWALPDTPTSLQFAPCTSQVLGLAAHDVRAPWLLLTLPLAFHLAHGWPRWHCWWAPGSWFSPPPWTQRSCLHFCAITQEEFLPSYLSICGTTAPQKPPEERISRAPRAWWAPNSSHGNSCSFWVSLGARGAGDSSLQLEGVPYLRTAHSTRVTARSQIAGCCLAGLVVLLRAWICKSWHVACRCEQTSPGWVAKHAGDQKCPPLHLAFSWRHLMHDQGQAHRMSLVTVGSLWPGREKQGEKEKRVFYFWLKVF